MFQVTCSPGSNLVEATIAGFLDGEEVRRYAARVGPMIAQAAGRPSGYTMLLDISGCTIQSQEVVAAFQRHVASVPRARRCAVVTGESAIRMQARRVMTEPTMRLFEDRVAARRWLLGGA